MINEPDAVPLHAQGTVYKHSVLGDWTDEEFLSRFDRLKVILMLRGDDHRIVFSEYTLEPWVLRKGRWQDVARFRTVQELEAFVYEMIADG